MISFSDCAKESAVLSHVHFDIGTLIEEDRLYYLTGMKEEGNAKVKRFSL